MQYNSLLIKLDRQCFFLKLVELKPHRVDTNRITCNGKYFQPRLL
jgi:hypothetical protein